MADLVAIIIVAVVFYFIVKYFKKDRDSRDYDVDFDLYEASNSNYESNRSNRLFSKNIYEAIEEFARVCFHCKQTTGWAYENDFAVITVTQNEAKTKLDIYCRGDSIACCLPEKYRSLRDDNDLNCIHYIDENIEDYVKENYGSNVPTEADSLFYFYKKGDPHAIGESLWQTNNGNEVGIHIKLR